MPRFILHKRQNKLSAALKLLVHVSMDCLSGNFRENFIFANSVKRHTCDVKNLLLGHDLNISVIYSDFARILIARNFAYMGSFAKIKPSRKILNLQYKLCGHDVGGQFSFVKIVTGKFPSFENNSIMYVALKRASRLQPHKAAHQQSPIKNVESYYTIQKANN